MVGLSALDVDVVPLTKEARSSFLTNSTCCSAVSSSGMDSTLLDSEALSTSRLSSLYGGADRAGQRLTILEEDLETDGAALSQKQVQKKLFDLHSVRVLKQVPLPDWMKIFVPRIVRLQTGTVPYMEYARCEKGEVRQRQMISVWTRVDRLPKNKLSIDFRMPADGERSTPSPSPAASKGSNDKVSRDKWILKFDTKNERDQWAKLVQDAIDLLGWIAKFTLGGVIMETQNSSVVECSTWMDRNRPSYVMKSMEASSTKQSHSARNEIEIQRMLTNYSSHPNIVALHDSFRQKEKAYLVMENCVGGDLFDFISQNGGMDEHEAKTLFRHIASAVNHCHEHGIVHLDIKPENLFFKVSALQLETVKLGDFGSAMQLDKSTLKKAISCTVGYAAPEVLQNGKVSYAADVFSAGAVLYTILCGYSPFSAPSEDDMLERTLSGEIFFDELEWWRISNEAKELVKQMMHADADQRPSMEEVLEHPWFSKW
ncbi:CAMK/CDPK protein kinase [Phytophthora cinnamomi]|uniref:CAMK/CDPK protein kinase n=1 Tax=Phytophthora cinnamomi TaxID=4785 RepID=UPI00355A7CB2|nr:CAMK/CDPK protein kinase [Phytophthora cinnamomi]